MPRTIAAAARAQWRLVADQIRPKVPKLAALMDEAETNGISPNEAAIPRLVGAILLEQNDEWAVLDQIARRNAEHRCDRISRLGADGL